MSIEMTLVRRCAICALVLTVAVGVTGCRGQARTDATSSANSIASDNAEDGNHSVAAVPERPKAASVPLVGDSVCTVLPAEIINDSSSMAYHVVAQPPYGSAGGSQLSLMRVDDQKAGCKYRNETDATGKQVGKYFVGEVEVERVSDINAKYNRFLQEDICMQRERMVVGSCLQISVGNAVGFKNIYQDGRTEETWTVFMMEKNVIVTAAWPSYVQDSATWMQAVVDRLSPQLS